MKNKEAISEVVGIKPRDGYLPQNLLPIAVGFGNLYRCYAKQLKKKGNGLKAEAFFKLSLEWIEKVLEQNPCNSHALAEKSRFLANTMVT